MLEEEQEVQSSREVQVCREQRRTQTQGSKEGKLSFPLAREAEVSLWPGQKAVGDIHHSCPWPM